ncbi:MAG: efflux RND transporter permease subunit [Gammaproteobacteria bacterium]|nr:MAG: efflux RND transporter permease subunit [Gammaproteobacteria bacterium]
MTARIRTGGLAAWSVRRPIAVTMLALAVVVIGLFSFDRLNIDLLPKLIYPEVRVRIVDTGVPARIMEDQITRQLEEQLAITEGAISVQSRTTEGRSSVDLSFPYGTDIDIALREASTRLDRAKRFLPDTIEPPVIFKRDPSQIPVLELVVSSQTLDPVELRSWVDYEFSKWFLNIEGVASTEVGGGLTREIQIIIDQEKLAAAGFVFEDVIDSLQKENLDVASGTLYMENRQLSTRTQGRFSSVETIGQLPLISSTRQNIDTAVRLSDVAQVLDTHEDEKLRVRLNGTPGVKLSIQKQPTANTVAVVDAVLAQLEWFREQKLLPEDIVVDKVADQSTYVRYSLRNASMAALSGALLAMFIVYLFLGDLRRTLIISTAIPLAILVTFAIMGVSGLTLNIMSLGGLALGIGILLDNTIVMLENISRHQTTERDHAKAAIDAAAEVTSAVTASTTTNLVAVLPFLFIGGLVGLLFSELIITLTAAIIASLIVALTLVPALGARIETPEDAQHSKIEHILVPLRKTYAHVLERVIKKSGWLFLIMIPLMLASAWVLYNAKDEFFPSMDEGRIDIGITADTGTRLEQLDLSIARLEKLFMNDADVSTVFTTSGGRIFGRSEYQSSNTASISVQLKPLTVRNLDSKAWVKKIRKDIDKLQLAGMKITLRVASIRGVRLGSGDDDISIRISGPDLEILYESAEEAVKLIKDVPGLSNLTHSYEEQIEELVMNIDRERAADLDINAEDIGRALSTALNGLVISDYIEGDRQYDIRLRLPQSLTNSTQDIMHIIVAVQDGKIIRLKDVARVEINPTPSEIRRDGQRRIVEISASLKDGAILSQVMKDVYQRLDNLTLPEGYSLYDGGSLATLKEGQQTGYILLGLALFLVIVVMAVQYESLTNPIIIIIGALFSIIGVAIGVETVLADLLSMPAKIGIIMLVGIVVNNSIVLVEQIEIQREKGESVVDAILTAAQLRLRPILMTTLTTVVGMLPLAIGLGEGSEMLQPLATVIVFGLSFATLVSMFLIPSLYYLINRKHDLA